MAQTPSLIFITGGVRSGKSSFAERVARKLAAENNGQLYYLATGVPFDAEMKKRIDKHQHDREMNSDHWKTIEQPVQIGTIAGQLDDQDILLLDCVTTLLTNELFLSEGTLDDARLKTVGQQIVSGIRQIRQHARTIIVVSNEVLSEPIPKDEFTLMYEKTLGKIHRKLVKEADQAFLVEAGIPVLMKGGTP